MHLYELTEEARILDEFFAESEGEITPELETLLNAHEASLKEKVDGYCKYMAAISARVEGIEREIERLSYLRGQVKRRAEWLKGYLHRNLKACGQTKIETGLFRVFIRKNPPRVVIDNDNAIPERYKLAVIKLPADRMPETLRPYLIGTANETGEIGAALKRGEEVIGAHLEQGESLTIK